MERKIIISIVTGFALAYSAMGSGDNPDWESIAKSASTITLSKDAILQERATGSFVAATWALRKRGVNLKVMLTDRNGQLLDWSSPSFRVENVSAVVVIPIRTEGKIMPFAFTPLSKDVIYTLIRDM